MTEIEENIPPRAA